MGDRGLAGSRAERTRLPRSCRQQRPPGARYPASRDARPGPDRFHDAVRRWSRSGDGDGGGHQDQRYPGGGHDLPAGECGAGAFDRLQGGAAQAVP